MIIKLLAVPFVILCALANFLQAPRISLIEYCSDKLIYGHKEDGSEQRMMANSHASLHLMISTYKERLAEKDPMVELYGKVREAIPKKGR